MLKALQRMSGPSHDSLIPLQELLCLCELLKACPLLGARGCCVLPHELASDFSCAKLFSSLDCLLCLQPSCQVGHLGSVELISDSTIHSMAEELEAPSTEQQTTGKKGKVRPTTGGTRTQCSQVVIQAPSCSAAPQGEALGPRWHQALGDSQVCAGR